MNPIKQGAVVFGGVCGFVVVQADRGMLPAWLQGYRSIPFGDKLGHFVLVGLLAFLINLALEARSIRIGGRVILSGSFYVSIGVLLEEFSQLAVPTRSFSLSDLVADFLGIWMAGIWVRRVCRGRIGAGSPGTPPL